MVTHSATLFWGGLRHPVRSLQKQLSKRVAANPDQLPDETSAAAHDGQSSERLERIAAYARSGYFHMEYTAGMFVVPLDLPPR
jgi:hypothetical protein